MYALLSQIRQNIVMYDVLMPPSYLLKRRDVSRRNIIGFYPSDEPPRKYQFSLSQPDWQTRDVKRTAKSSKRLSNIHSQNDRPTFSKVSFRLPVKSKRTSNVRSESSDTYTRTFGTYVAERVISPRTRYFMFCRSRLFHNQCRTLEPYFNFLCRMNTTPTFPRFSEETNKEEALSHTLISNQSELQRMSIVTPR